MGTPTIETLVDAAIERLLTLPAQQLYAVATEKRVPFFPDDDLDHPVLLKAVFPSARALRKALVARDALVRRSALFLLTSADAASAWPILKPFVSKRPPAKTKGFEVVTKMAASLIGTIPNIPDEELLPLFDNPRVEPQALVAGLLFHRKKPEERLEWLQRALADRQNDGTIELACALGEELIRRSRAELVTVLRAPTHASWKSWTKASLLAIGETPPKGKRAVR